MTKILFDRSVAKFIASLEKPTIAKALRIIDLLEKFSHQLNLPHGKKMKPNLFELRIRGQQEVRIFYTFHQEGSIVMLHGFVKKSQKTPKQEIRRAEKKLKDLT